VSIAVLVCVATAAATAQAQGASYHSSDPQQDTMTEAEAAKAWERYHQRELPIWTLGYSMALGVGDLNDYIGNASFRGFEVALLWPVVRSLFLGVTFGYNGFYEATGHETYQLESAAVNAKLYRYADSWPLALVGRYLFLQNRSMLRPYLGVRVGAAWVDTTTLVTDRTYQDSSFGFLAAPEAGILVHLSAAVLACVSYAFNFTTASPGERDAIAYNSLVVGVTLQP